MKAKLCAVVFASILFPGFTAGQINDGNKVQKDSYISVIKDNRDPISTIPVVTSVDNLKADCLACPSYDYLVSPLTSYQTHSSSIVSNGCKIYLLAVSDGSAYTFKTGCGDGATADFDSYLELYDSSCGYITGNDDGCESNRSIITWTSTYSGYAYVKVRGYNSSYYGSFTLAYKSDPWCQACPSYDFSVSPTMAYQIHSSSISSYGCRIYFLNVTSGSQYTFKTGCGDWATADFDTYLELYNNGCGLVTYNDDGCESARSIITWTATYTGAAYLKVKAYSSYFGSYTLAYSAINPSLCKICPSYDYNIYPTTNFQTYSSSIPGDGCKIYAVNVTSGKQYTFKTGCGDGATAGFDTFIELFDTGCNSLLTDDDGCESNRSIITWTATYSGTAYLKVRGYNIGAYGSYTLAYNEIQIPNIWLGTYSYQWENPANWNLGHVPTADEEVIIAPAGYQPCIIAVSSQQCKSLEIQAGAYLAIDNRELQSHGNITINGGLSMYNNSVVKLAGNWSRNPTTGAFAPGPGRVVFNNPLMFSQYCSSETFNYLELNNPYNLLIMGATVTCNYYDWTSGVLYLDAATFTALDLVDEGIFGQIAAYSASTVNLTNNNGYVDLNGSLYIYDNSYINVYGGTTPSYWAYSADAMIQMDAGSVLDFKSQGIVINNSVYNLVTYIFGGTIRTVGGFSGNRSDFHPDNGTFEFYGSSDYTISQSNGCSLHDVLINKGAKESEKSYPTGPIVDKKSGKTISDGGKSNMISLDSDIAITGDLTIGWGSTFDLDNYNCDVANNVMIYGILGMTFPTDLSAYWVQWKDGSTDNITNGTIHVDYWSFENGSYASLGTGNTAYVTTGIYLDYSSSAFGNLVLSGSTNQGDNGSKAPELDVNGNLTVLSGAGWTFWSSIIAQGNVSLQNNSSLIFETKSLSVGGNADIAGSVMFNNGGIFTVEGDLIFPASGNITLNNAQFTCLHPGNATLNGSLVMNSGSIASFPERDVTIGPNFNDNSITGGTFQFGASLFAPTPGTFQIIAANTEFVSLSASTEEIAITSNNWLGNVLIQRSMYIEVTDNLNIKGNLNITDNKLQVNGKVLTVEGDITVPHGILSLFTGSQLNIGGSLVVGTYGLFETYGVSGNLNRIYGGTYGTYSLVVNSGGVMRGEYTTFEDMDDHGIWIQNGAIVDPAAPLNYCIFKNGAAGGGLLTIENTQSLTILSPNFPVITPGGGHNIIKLSNSGIIEMNNATGAMAGPAFENDPYNRVNWTGGMAGLWTGNVSTDWFNFSNWSNFTVPDMNVSVLIPSGCSYNPVISAGLWAYCYNLTVDPGANLTIENGKALSNNNVYIGGNLTMTNALSELQALDIYFQSGSTDNVTAGAIRCNNFEFSENTLAKFSGLNTVFCAWASCEDPFAEFANLHIVPYSKKGNWLNGSKTSFPIRVTGDFVMEPGSFYTPYSDLVITGNSEIQAGAMLGDYSGPELDMTCSGNLNIAGNMRLYYSSEVLVHGNLSLTGYLMIYPDCEFTCDYNSATGWTTLNGTLDFYPGADFKITGANVLIGPSFNLIEQAPYPPYFNAEMMFGRSLSAPSANFQVDYCYTEFISNNTGHYIDLNSANYLLSLIINKYSGGDLYLQSDLTVKDMVSIGYETTLRAYNKTMYVGGDWYENYYSLSGGFLPMTGRVIFNGTADQTIYGQTDFNILEISKPGGQFVVPSGSTSICNSYDYTAGGIRIDGGTFTAVDMYDAFFNGTNQLTNGSLNISQDVSQDLGLYGNLNISGGVMNVTCASQSFYWGFYENCNVTMNNGEMIVNAPEGLAIPSNYSGVLTENITGGTIKVYTELDVVNSAFTPTGGTIELVGPVSSLVAVVIPANLYNLIINKGALEDEFQENQVALNTVYKSDGKVNDAILYSDLNIAGMLTVAKGTLNLNSYQARVSGDANVNNGATLTVNAGADLLMAANKSLAVNDGGKLNVIGTAGNEARVSRISTGNYTFDIESGGTIGAQYGIFEYTGTNGINIKTGSIVDAAYPFNNCTFRNGISAGKLLTVNNSQTFTANNAVFPTNTWGGTYNVYKNVNSGTVNFVGATGGFAGAPFEYDPNNRINWSPLSFSLSLKAYLEGPFNGTNMNTALNGILSLSHPFNPALPYFGNPMPEWYYTGSGSVGAIPNTNIVDWVMVELRDAANASLATKATRFAQIPAFILSNGSIVALDGVSNLQFTGTLTQNLFVVIHNRNHQGIMNANLIPLVSGTYTYDFTTGASQVHGGTAGHKQLTTGVWGMRSGDGNGDGYTSILDKSSVWGLSSQLGKTGYMPSDYNFDRQANNKDKNDKWVPNLGSGSMVP